MSFDPIPHLRWFEKVELRPVPGRIGGPLHPTATRVLQVGYRPINGGDVVWQDIPVVKDPASCR